MFLEFVICVAKSAVVLILAKNSKNNKSFSQILIFEGVFAVNKAARSVLRRISPDTSSDDQRDQIQAQQIKAEQEKIKARKEDVDSDSAFEAIPEEMLTESEKRHAKHRRQQAQAGRFTPAAERLPIMTKEEREAHNKNRPKWTQTSFEGPIEKLIEKYKDLDEVKRHLTLGQSMKYEFTEDGCVRDQKGNLVYDGQQVVNKT